MTFDEFWKNKSGWWSENIELYDGTSEYSLAKDAYEAGVQSQAEYIAELEKDLQELRDRFF